MQATIAYLHCISPTDSQHPFNGRASYGHTAGMQQPRKRGIPNRTQCKIQEEKPELTRDAEALERRGAAAWALPPTTALGEANLAMEETALPAAAAPMIVAIAEVAQKLQLCTKSPPQKENKI